MTNNLNNSILDEVMIDCLFKREELIDGKQPDDAITVDGIVTKFGFHRNRLELNKPKIRDMLLDLPDEFVNKGGWSFLMACTDKDGTQWGEQRDAEALMCLGIACKYALILLPRDKWHALPGGVPYFAVTKECKLAS